MDRKTAKLWALFLSIPVSGAPAIAASQEAPVPGASNFTFIDDRPLFERKNKALSTMIWNCNFGVQNIGDEGIYKSHTGSGRVDDLAAKLSSALSESGRHHSITLKRHRLTFNSASASLADSVGAGLGGGVLAPAIADGKTRRPKCSKEKMTAGWFDPAEISNNNTPFIIEIDMIVDERPISIRKVYSPTFELMKKGLKPQYVSEIGKFILDTNDLAVSEAAKTAE